MSTEASNGVNYTREALSKVTQLLDQIEQPLRVFVENNGIAGMLIDEQDPWDWSKREGRLRTEGVESYQFRKEPTTGDGFPTRGVNWRGKDGLYYLIDIYLGKDVEDLIMWSVVSLDYNSLREERAFQQKEPIKLPMPEADFTQLLQAKYDLLHREATELKLR